MTNPPVLPDDLRQWLGTVAAIGSWPSTRKRVYKMTAGDIAAVFDYIEALEQSTSSAQEER